MLDAGETAGSRRLFIGVSAVNDITAKLNAAST
jgi:hypothetical protein